MMNDGDGGEDEDEDALQSRSRYMYTGIIGFRREGKRERRSRE